jgi:hypothetical protein
MSAGERQPSSTLTHSEDKMQEAKLSNPFMTQASAMGPVNGPSPQPNAQPMAPMMPMMQPPAPQPQPQQNPQQNEALLQMLAHIHPETLKNILNQRRTADLNPVGPQAPQM